MSVSILFVCTNFRYQNVTVLEEKGDKCTAELYLETGENISVKCRSGQWQYTPLHREKTIVSDVSEVSADIFHS